tara:strand:- start:219 stop:485 length:267 start_codon:yes stop_codon:yes gene_type:complete
MAHAEVNLCSILSSVDNVRVRIATDEEVTAIDRYLGLTLIAVNRDDLIPWLDQTDGQGWGKRYPESAIKQRTIRVNGWSLPIYVLVLK